MYTYEERKRAVELLIKYDMQYAYTIQKLGFPNSKSSLRHWYTEYIKNGDLKESYLKRKPKYSEEQIDVALKYYTEHGENVSKTIRALGYPSRTQLQWWIDERFPERKKLCTGPRVDVEYSTGLKKEATISLMTRTESAESVAETFGVSRVSLYNWKNELLGKEYSLEMKGNSAADLEAENKDLLAENERLKQENFRLQLENDILNAASEVIKKDPGINLKTLSNREKADVIDALREKYRLKTLLTALGIAKSSYCYQKIAKSRPDKYESNRLKIREIFQESNDTYGYRRVHASLAKEGTVLSEKVVRRIMKEEHLAVPFVKMKKYSSYLGEISPAVENLVNRDFHADAPNKLWLTDITEFHIPAGKIYLSPIVDCFDGLPTAWTIGTSPNAEMVNTMLLSAIGTLKDDEKPVVHTDRGAHYRWPRWIEIMEKNGLVRSMSKKGYSPDNAACEGFHGRIKNEFFYNRDWMGVSIDEFMYRLDKYLHWYSEKRIKMSLGGMSPMEYRRSLGLAG